jgi:hypothetical protein
MIVFSSHCVEAPACRTAYVPEITKEKVNAEVVPISSVELSLN